jgi:hypothetical protein
MKSIFNRRGGKHPAEIVLYVEASAKKRKAPKQKISSLLAALITKRLPLTKRE